MPTETLAPPEPAAPRLRTVARVLRVQEWWEYKVARYVGVAYAFAYHERLPFSAVWHQALLLLLALFGCAGFVSVINEITDREADARVGKKNGMIGRSFAFQAGTVLACVVPGAVIAWWMRDCPVAVVLYFLIWLVFILYSFPPFRLKSRGFAGSLADAVGEQVLPVLLAASLMTEANHHEVAWYLAVPLVVWSFAFGLRGILDHQMRDRENDLLAGIHTAATTRSVPDLSRVVTWGIYPVEAAALLVFLAMFGLVGTWPILAVCLLVETRHGNFGRLLNSWRNPEPDNWLPLVEYYKFYFPITFLLAMAWSQPEMIWILLAHVVLFNGCSRQAVYAVAGLVLAPVRGGYAAWHAGSSRGRPAVDATQAHD
jgi:4-hydroxybenzoate polyprenyltransferase